MGFWRDHSNRLTYDVPDITYQDYAEFCSRIVRAFVLKPTSELFVGLDQMFWSFHRENQTLGFDWDVWMQFMIVAHSPEAEPLVREIAWLDSVRS